MQQDQFIMSLRELSKQRDRFRPAPGVMTTEELPLIEKQALVDEVLRGMPIRGLEVCEQADGNGKTIYVVVQGWLQLQAILDFTDGKFPTWSAEEMKSWQRGQ